MAKTTPDFEIWPGPMEGVGKAEFVRAVNSLHLTDRWMTPFLRISEHIPREKKLTEFAAEYFAGGLPVSFQLMGNDPEKIGLCGKKLLELLPASDINLNLGCPSNRVIKSGAGGGLLKAPHLIADLCSEIAGYLPPGMLTVKIRAGWSDPEDMKIFLPALARSNAVSKIFFHYRTVAELYSPAPLPYRNARLRQAVELAAPLPVIANGDISSVADGQKVVADTGCAGVMIARPWMRDPYLLRRFSGNAPDAETGREKFFQELRSCNIHGGALLEFARMLWGTQDRHFRELLNN